MLLVKSYIRIIHEFGYSDYLQVASLSCFPSRNYSLAQAPAEVNGTLRRSPLTPYHHHMRLSLPRSHVTRSTHRSQAP